MKRLVSNTIPKPLSIRLDSRKNKRKSSIDADKSIKNKRLKKSKCLMTLLILPGKNYPN